MRASRIEKYYDTIWAIVESKYVEGYVIGFTSRPAWKRLQESIYNEYDHLVIIVDQLSRAEALSLEKELHRRVHLDKSHLTYKKYSYEKRDKPYRSSYGGIAGDPKGLRHSVYIKWWEPSDEDEEDSN